MGLASTITGRIDRASHLSLVARLRAALHRRRVYRRTLAELNALTTRELADLGLTRSMLTRVALEAAYGRKAGE
ncbi:MAG: DUF1127 domain-containing protein [Gemmobacter sp.]